MSPWPALHFIFSALLNFKWEGNSTIFLLVKGMLKGCSSFLVEFCSSCSDIVNNIISLSLSRSQDKCSHCSCGILSCSSDLINSELFNFQSTIQIEFVFLSIEQASILGLKMNLNTNMWIFISSLHMRLFFITSSTSWDWTFPTDNILLMLEANLLWVLMTEILTAKLLWKKWSNPCLG